MNDRVSGGVLGDRVHDPVDFGEEAFAERGTLCLVPAVGVVDVGRRSRANDQRRHLPFRILRRTSSPRDPDRAVALDLVKASIKLLALGIGEGDVLRGEAIPQPLEEAQAFRDVQGVDVEVWHVGLRWTVDSVQCRRVNTVAAQARGPACGT